MKPSADGYEEPDRPLRHIPIPFPPMETILGGRLDRARGRRPSPAASGAPSRLGRRAATSTGSRVTERKGLARAENGREPETR